MRYVFYQGTTTVTKIQFVTTYPYASCQVDRVVVNEPELGHDNNQSLLCSTYK